MELTNGRYHIQGVALLDIAGEFGTPVYVYDGDKIVHQLKTLQTTFADSNIKVKYAMKALTNLSVLKLLKKNGSGVDVVSVNEGRIALRAGFEPKDIMFTSNNVSIDEIVEAVDLGFHINMDNLSILEKFGEKYGSSYPCCIRLNPGILAGGNYKISTGHSKSKFGIPIAQLEQIKALVAQYNIKITGLHIHTGSEIADLDVFMKMAEILFGWADQFTDVKVLDFGGGFKVAYKPEDVVLDISAFGEKVNTAFQDFKKRTRRELELWVEPGKYIVSECGYLLATVNIVKENPNITFLGVNSGLNHLIRPMMYDAYHEIVNISNVSASGRTYTVVGNVCETDTLGADRQMAETAEGDVLAIKNAGAYGFAMASNYNSRLRPAEVLIMNGKPHLVRHRDTLEDLLRGQIDVF
jgi:diaminopimelate decarboxylase